MSTLRAAFDELLDELKSVRSQAEVKLSELQSIDKSQTEIATMIRDIIAVLDEEDHLANDFKEKKQAVEKMANLLTDINDVDQKLVEINSHVLETGYDLSVSNSEAMFKLGVKISRTFYYQQKS